MKVTNLIGTRITLNEVEKQTAVILARSRKKNNADNGMKSKITVDYDVNKAELEGVAGELAMAKLLNVYPDYTIYTRSSRCGTEPYDLLLSNETCVGVKTTSHYKGKLINPVHKNITADLFALLVLVNRDEWWTLEFRGFFEQHKLHVEERKGTLPNQNTLNYIATQDELKDLKDVEVTYETINQMDS